MDESLLGPWNTYQREQEGDVRGGEEEGGCVHFTRKDGKTSKERQRKGEERGTQEISRAWMAYKKKLFSKHRLLNYLKIQLLTTLYFS